MWKLFFEIRKQFQVNKTEDNFNARRLAERKSLITNEVLFEVIVEKLD